MSSLVISPAFIPSKLPAPWCKWVQVQVGPHDGVVSSSIDDTAAAALAAERSREDAWKTVGGGGNIGFGSTGSQVFKYRSFRWPPLPAE